MVQLTEVVDEHFQETQAAPGEDDDFTDTGEFNLLALRRIAPGIARPCIYERGRAERHMCEWARLEGYMSDSGDGPFAFEGGREMVQGISAGGAVCVEHRIASEGFGRAPMGSSPTKRGGRCLAFRVQTAHISSPRHEALNFPLV